MTTQEILEEIHRMADEGDEIYLADGFEEALIGTVSGGALKSQAPIACYDYEKCVEVLMTRDGMDREEAEEHLNFNTVGALGDGLPVYLYNMRDSDQNAQLGNPADSE